MKVAGRILYILALCFILWFALSYFEIHIKNTTADPQYSKYNCFMITYEIICDKEFKP